MLVTSPASVCGGIGASGGDEAGVGEPLCDDSEALAGAVPGKVLEPSSDMTASLSVLKRFVRRSLPRFVS